MSDPLIDAPPQDLAPFVHSIAVTWGDCDPAQIAYTGRLPEFALAAINAWWEHHFDGDGWFEMQIDHNLGTPFVHLSLDFSSPVTPRHRLECEVAATALGETSIRFRVIGRQNGVTCFTGRFVCVFMIADQFRKRPPPERIRARLLALIQPEPAARDI